jgi:ABC-type bacteriocin/lantibiotic exporter with double-glycine peptidase domain
MTDEDGREEDTHDEIERLEAQIDELSAKLESCRKFILIARVAVVVGAILLAVVLLGLLSFDPRLLLAAITALLAGFVVWGSNHSTADEAARELAAAEAERASLIESITLRVVTERPTLH